MATALDRPIVLVLEDDELIARALQRELGFGFEVVTARDPVEAVALIAGRPEIRAAVCDCDLGAEANGVDVLEVSRRFQGRMVRVMVSGMVPDELGPLMVSGTIHRFIAKPWQPGSVLTALREELDQRA